MSLPLSLLEMSSFSFNLEGPGDPASPQLCRRDPERPAWCGWYSEAGTAIGEARLVYIANSRDPGPFSEMGLREEGRERRRKERESLRKCCPRL